MLEVAERSDFSWPLAATATNGRIQEAGDQAQKFPGLERFENEADGSGAAEVVCILRSPGGQRNHWNPACRRVGLQLLDHGQSVHVRHVVVEKDQVGVDRPHHRQCVLAS